MNRLERLYAVSEEIRRHHPGFVSARELAEKFGVSRRTMERDLASLRNSGVPVYASPGRTGGQAILQSGSSRHPGRHTVFLSAEEITGLLMAVTASAPMPFGMSAVAGAERILDSLPDEVQVSVGQLRARIRVAQPVDPKPLSSGTRPSDTRPSGSQARRTHRVLEEAVRTSRVVNLQYTDSEETRTSRSVEAVGFYRGERHWFLIGWCRLRQSRRLFRLDRIRSAALTAEHFPNRDVDATLGWVPGATTQPG